MCAHTCRRKHVDIRRLSEASVFTLFTEAMPFNFVSQLALELTCLSLNQSNEVTSGPPSLTSSYAGSESPKSIPRTCVSNYLSAEPSPRNPLPPLRRDLIYSSTYMCYVAKDDGLKVLIL